MKTKMTKTEALLIQFLVAFLLFLHVNAVDPVSFLISKTFVENKTLIPLPEDLQFKGDPANDSCTAQIIVTVTDYEEPDEGSGIESPKKTESQPETGQITFQFDHPNIRNEDVNFTVVVNEKDEGLTRARHVLRFDKCLILAQKTFNFSAESTMATMKDVKMIIVNGKDDNIVNAVDPVFFLISATFVENKTLIPLPEDLEYKGDPVNDSCTAQIIVTVTDYEEPDEGSGIESPKKTESQPEAGEITFQFDHPNIRNEYVNFTVVVNEKDEGLTRACHVLRFDKCLILAQKTFNFSAESTMATMKDVKMVIVNGKDDNIDCANTNVTRPNSIPQNETATQPPIIIVVQKFSLEYITALGIIIFVLMGVCYRLYRRMRNVNNQNTDNQESMQLSNMGPDIENNEIKETHEESEEPGERNGPGDSTSDSDKERGIENQTKSKSRNKLRGGKSGTNNSLLSVEQEDLGKCQRICKICKEK